MKLCSVKWKNDPVLGDLDLNFCNLENGKPYDTIVFVGENGTGKTTIFNLLSRFISGYPIKNIAELCYQINNQIYRALPPDEEEQNWVGYYDIVSMDGIKTSIFSGMTEEGSSNINPRDKTDTKNIRNYGCFYSPAEANFRTTPIRNVTAKNWTDRQKNNLSDEQEYTSIKQMIVDLDDRDCRDFAFQCKQNPNCNFKWEDFHCKSNMFRFTNAIDHFFDHINYEKVLDINNEKQILFNKNGSSISIDSLSTGEKQIVFRAADLLRHLNQINGGCVFIDEPEISLHPKWSQKILGYYKKLVTNDLGEQICQLFIASHSEYVLAQALSDKENTLVIILAQNNGKITGQVVEDPVLLGETRLPEISYLTFGVPSSDYHNLLYGEIQNKFNLTSIKKCDNFLVNSTFYNSNRLMKVYTHKNCQYMCLSTYIRNCIDHPDDRKYTIEELQNSIDFLRKILKSQLK